MNTPYTYLIGWSNLKMYYFGVRYAKYCYPGDLWISYFTSSKYVKEFTKKHGNPNIIKIIKTFKTKHEAIDSEYKFLIKNNADVNKYFLNMHVNNGKRFKNYDTISNKTKLKISISLKKYFSNIENITKHREKMKNKPPVSFETKEKLKKIRNDLIWISNYKQDKMIHSNESEYYFKNGWIKGRKFYIPKTKGNKKHIIKKTIEELKEIRRNSRLGKPSSKESIEKRVKINSKSFFIVYPNGDERIIQNLSLFCKMYNLTASCMHAVLNGVQTHHKGYKIYRVIKSISLI